MFSNIKYSVKLAALVVLAIASALFISWRGIAATSQVNDMLNSMYDNNLVPIKDVANANMQAIYNNRGLLRYIIADQNADMDKIAARMAEEEKAMHELLDKYRKTQLTPEEVEQLKAFDEAWPQYVASRKIVMEASYAHDNESAMKVYQEQTFPKFQVADDILSKIVHINEKLAKTAYDDSDVIVAHIRNTLLILTVLIAGVFLAIAMVIIKGLSNGMGRANRALDEIAAGNLRANIEVNGSDEIETMLGNLQKMQVSLRDTVRSISNNADQVASAAVQLAQSSSEVASSVTQQVEATSGAAASVEELSVSIDQVAHNANEAQNNANAASGNARQSASIVGKSMDMVHTVHQAVGQSAGQIDALSARIQQIDSITNVIKEVADQTNLLALNAAIEAARAGEQGRGFAVVADEVRKLAERTTNSAREISEMINVVRADANSAVSSMHGSSATVENVVTISGEAVESMTEANEGVEKILHSVSQIASSLGEQRHAGIDVAQRIERIAQMSEETSASMEEINASAEMLSDVAQQMLKSMGKFKT
ncbi:methyl-accepting chemotaxis protein [Chitinibacter bivalviorum]|uniref:Methyl-accepting chemotaxis protein n=1 Tax=Chitinibacter bivalviorum TaxID=2739434 RepID=A0A7H9BJ20_9NEIS|nr:methyl-accepting chemotaxis protein [Chitinibacter bivalviorum]QLG88640.1 methyl-accepting chemotaxis protein [Chitinibacter bivalviorum]